MKYAILITTLFIAGCADGIQQDKVLHAGAGAIASTFVTEVTGSPVTGVVAAGLAGMFKEASDAANGGKFDMDDVGATILGGFVGLIRWEVKF